MTEYRKIWNEEYAEIQQERTVPPGLNELKRFAETYRYYFRGWLPDNKEASVLDLGCGAGFLLNFLVRQGFTPASGIDTSDSQIRIAQQLGLKCEQQEAVSYLKNHLDEYALVTAIDLVEHLDKNECLEFLDTAFNSLQPGGRLVLQTPNGESPWVGNVLYGDLTHEQCFTPDLLKKLMHRAGFTSIEARACGPAPVTPTSFIRFCIWEGITQVCRILNLIEGAVSCGIYTRVFLISGVRP